MPIGKTSQQEHGLTYSCDLCCVLSALSFPEQVNGPRTEHDTGLYNASTLLQIQVCELGDIAYTLLTQTRRDKCETILSYPTMYSF